MPYKFLEEITRADVAFEATGKDLNELFKSAGKATMEAMANTESVKQAIEKEIEISDDNVEMLMFSFLEEIVFLKDKDNIVFADLEVDVNKEKLTVKAKLKGDTIKPEEQELHQDVKAVTMHYFKVEKTEKGWKTQVVLDI